MSLHSIKPLSKVQNERLMNVHQALAAIHTGLVTSHQETYRILRERQCAGIQDHAIEAVDLAVASLAQSCSDAMGMISDAILRT